MSDSEGFIEVRGLTKSFQDAPVLKQLDLTVKKGKVVTLLGPSGCGKTTMLRCVAGLEKPDAGVIRIGGVVANGPDIHLPPRQRGLGIVFQSFALWPHMTVAENVAFPLRRKRTPDAEINRRVAAVLALVGLGHAAARYPGQLSGGQQQRVALARALVGEPGAILYDEPLSNLDARLREQMRVEIGDLHRRLGITAIFVTHDQEEAIDLSDEIHVMLDGAVIQKGAPLDIFDRPRTKFVCEFLGQANILPVADATRASDGRVRVVARSGLQILCDPPANPDRPIRHVAIRPHRIAIAPGSQPAPPRGTNAFSGKVQAVRHHGARSRYQVAIDGAAAIEAEAPRGAGAFAVDETVWIRFDPADCVCLED